MIYKKIKILLFIIINIFKNKNYKIYIRKFFNKFDSNNRKEAQDWAKNKFESYERFCEINDKKLWIETKEYCEQFEINSRKILDTLPIKLSGKGNIFLIYFLTRKLKPRIVFETGVSAGWSSMVFFEAFKRNNIGKLYSSDFPDAKKLNVEKYTGILVKDKYKKKWSLDINGDIVALNKFISEIKDQTIDFFHYDSDKSVKGRNFAFNLIKDKISSKSVVIFDDIGDNLHFKELVEKEKLKYKIFKYKSDYLGLIFNFNECNK
tara:strand:+ start:1106 stop:1894 length:789 start_codon:yes stop_codon:yes gene_type:complete